MIARLKAPPEKIWVVPSGVDTALFTPRRAMTAGDRLRDDLVIAADRPILVAVGRGRDTDDLDIAIRALSELHSLRGWAPVLVIADELSPADAELRARLLALASECGVAADIRFAGRLSRVALADLLAVATLTVAPTPTGARSLASLASMASGTPVLGYVEPGEQLPALDQRPTLTLDSRSPATWAHEITGLLDDHERLDELSARARRDAEASTWASTAAALISLYSSLR